MFGLVSYSPDRVSAVRGSGHTFVGWHSRAGLIQARSCFGRLEIGHTYVGWQSRASFIRPGSCLGRPQIGHTYAGRHSQPVLAQYGSCFGRAPGIHQSVILMLVGNPGWLGELGRVGLGRAGLGGWLCWAGLVRGWARLAGLGWLAVLGWAGLGRAGLGMAGMAGWAGLGGLARRGWAELGRVGWLAVLANVSQAFLVDPLTMAGIESSQIAGAQRVYPDLRVAYFGKLLLAGRCAKRLSGCRKQTRTALASRS